MRRTPDISTSMTTGTDASQRNSRERIGHTTSTTNTTGCLHAGRKQWDSSSSVISPDNRFRFNGKEDHFVDLDGRDTIYVFDTPYRPNDKGVYGETYTAETYVEINGKLSGPYRSSSYPNSR